MITNKFLHAFAKFRIFHSLRCLFCNLVLVLVLGHKVSTLSHGYPVKYLKLSIIVLLALFIIQPSNASTTNVSILYGWNGTNFVPVQVTDAGAIKTDINLSQSTGLSPKLNNTYDLGQTGFLWANVYVRSIRGGSGPLSLFAGESERLTLLAGGNVGVNSASPQYKFEVGGNANITGELLVSNVSLLDRTQSDNTTQNNAITANNQTLSDRFGGDNTTQNNLITGNNNTLLANLGQKLNLTGGTLSGKLNVSGTDITNNISLAVNNTLYVNTSADRVGVGTSAPTQALHVVGSLNVTGSIWSSDANITAFTNVSIAYGYNGSNFVPLTTTSGGVLKLSVAQSSASHLTGTQSNATSMLISNNLTVLKNLSVGTTTLFVDQTATRVGISTASPSATLEVSGYNVVNNISLNVNNTLYVNNSGGGNVGIGTTAPGYKLDVNGDTNLAGAVTGVSTLGLSGTITSSKSGWFATQSVAGTVYRGMYMENTNSGLFLGVEGTPGGTILTGSTAYAAVINQQANKLMQFGTNNAVRMTIDNTGLVGIGTTSPSAGLQINTSNPTLRTNGSVFIDGNVGIGTTNPRAALEVYDSALIISKPTGTDKNWRFLPSDTTAGDLAIQQSATSCGIDFAAKVTFGATGSVGIGTTSPQRGLHLNGSNSVGSPEFVISNTDIVSGGRNFNIEADTTGTDFWALRTLTDDFIAQNTMFMSFQTGTGNIGIGTTAPSTALDIRRNGTLNLMVGNTNNTLGDVGQIAEIILNPATQLYGTTEAPRIYCYQEEASPYKAGIWFDTYAGGGIRSTRMVIQGNGNVGIGGTDASYQLSITEASGAGAFQASSAQNILALYNSNDNNNNWANMVFRFGPSGIIGGVIGVNSDNTGAGLGALHFATRDGTSLAQRMVISNSGNVGIGTTSPSAGLQINTSNPTLRTNGTVTIDGVLTIRDDINQFNKVMTGGNSGPSGNTGIQSFVAYDLNNNDMKKISWSGGLYFIYDSGDATKYAVISYSGSTVAAISTGSSVSTTKDTSSKINIYAENSKLVVQNKLGSLTTPFIYRFG